MRWRWLALVGTIVPHQALTLSIKRGLTQRQLSTGFKLTLLHSAALSANDDALLLRFPGNPNSTIFGLNIVATLVIRVCSSQDESPTLFVE